MKIIICLILIALSALGFAEESGSQYELFKSKTYVKNPLELRDPFKRKINKKKSQSVQNKNREQMMGIYSNINNSIENKSIENLRIIGVVLGQERKAMIKFVNEGANAERDPTIFYIKEGMKIGENGAEVKAILPGGVVLVEKIRNVYDQDEYLETVIPVSND